MSNLTIDEDEQKEHLADPTRNTLELGGGGKEQEKTGPDKKSIYKKVSPVLTINNLCIDSMRAGMTEEKDCVVVAKSPGLLFAHNTEQHMTSDSPGPDGDENLCGGMKNVVGCMLLKKADRLGDEESVQLNSVDGVLCSAKFGEALEPGPRGIKEKAMSLSDGERFGVSEVMTTINNVRPGENKGEAIGILLDQRQKDTEESDLKEHSRTI